MWQVTSIKFWAAVVWMRALLMSCDIRIICSFWERRRQKSFRKEVTPLHTPRLALSLWHPLLLLLDSLIIWPIIVIGHTPTHPVNNAPPDAINYSLNNAPNFPQLRTNTYTFCRSFAAPPSFIYIIYIFKCEYFEIYTANIKKLIKKRLKPLFVEWWILGTFLKK